MLEQASLREQLLDLLAKEKQAEQTYADLEANQEDSQLKEQIKQLRREKQRHINLTERLLEILD